MNKKQIQDVKKKLLEINTLISDLDPAIRSAAFNILAPLFFGDNGDNGKAEPAKISNKGKGPSLKAAHATDAGTFFAAFTHDKPNDNVHLIAAWLYSQYGLFPITRKDISDRAADIGLTIPGRPDMTMKAALHEKKKLYKKQGKGWQLTVHGETYLKKTYSVKKGSTPRPAEDDK